MSCVFVQIAYPGRKILHLQKNDLDWSDIPVCDDKDTDEESLSHTQEIEFVAGETDILLGFNKICLSQRYLVRVSRCFENTIQTKIAYQNQHNKCNSSSTKCNN